MDICRLLIFFALLAAAITCSLGLPLHLDASDGSSDHYGSVGHTRTRSSRPSTSGDDGSDLPSENTRTGAGASTSDRTSSGTASGDQTGRPEQQQQQDESSACEPLGNAQLTALVLSVRNNTLNMQRDADNIRTSILGDEEVFASLYPAPGETRLTKENLRGAMLGRSVNYLRCFLHPVAEALDNESHTEVFTHEDNYWRQFYDIVGNVTEAARDMEALVLGREVRPGISGCEVPSLNYPCRSPDLLPPTVDGLTVRQLLQGAVASEIRRLCYDLWPHLEQEWDSLSGN